MTQLSSRMTFGFKVVFTAFWFAVVGLAFVLGALMDPIQPAIFIAPAIMGIFGFVLFRVFLWSLADRVSLDGGELVIRKGKVLERRSLSDLAAIRSNPWINPERITLTFKTAGALGHSVKFMPPMRFGFSTHPIHLELERLAKVTP